MPGTGSRIGWLKIYQFAGNRDVVRLLVFVNKAGRNLFLGFQSEFAESVCKRRDIIVARRETLHGAVVAAQGIVESLADGIEILEESHYAVGQFGAAFRYLLGVGCLVITLPHLLYKVQHSHKVCG